MLLLLLLMSSMFLGPPVLHISRPYVVFSCNNQPHVEQVFSRRLLRYISKQEQEMLRSGTKSNSRCDRLDYTYIYSFTTQPLFFGISDTGIDLLLLHISRKEHTNRLLIIEFKSTEGGPEFSITIPILVFTLNLPLPLPLSSNLYGCYLSSLLQ